jgi:carbon-monoxide dehydrogenase small subunit
MSKHAVTTTVNGNVVNATVEARQTLGDFLREGLGLTGTHYGCEHGVCGACTIIVDGDPVRSCLMLAVQADGKSITTVEGLAEPGGELHPVQQAMRDEFGLQCGFCTPGIVMSLVAVTQNKSKPDEEELIDAVGGHICRCTGYQGIRRAVRRLAGTQPKGVDHEHSH